MVDVLCVGSAVFDIVHFVDRHPGEDEKCFSDDFVACGGGPAANAAVTVARMGGEAALAAYLGDDFSGDLHLNELHREGVDTTLIIRGDFPTPISSIIVKPSGSRTAVCHKGLTPWIKEDSFSALKLECRVLLFDGHEPLISLPLAKKAKMVNIPIVLDAGSLHRGTEELAPLADFLIASEKFALQVSKEKDINLALEKLGHISGCVVITMGSRGLVWKKGTEEGALKAFPVDAKDTTGAGDIFHGAFALGVAENLDFVENLVRASAAAALGCKKKGGRPGIPHARDVEEFLKKHSL